MRKTALTALAALLSMAATAQITETPEGEMLTNMEWQSKGFKPDYSTGQTSTFTETGAIAHVVKNGNDFYIQDPISQYKKGVWIKGTLSEDGTQVVFNTPQMFTTENGYTFYYYRMVQSGTKLAIGESTDLVFSYDGEKLVQTDGGYLAVATLQGQIAGYVDYNITIQPIGEECATPPTDSEMLTYKMTYEGQGAEQSKTVNVAFSGTDVYIANPTGVEGSWIKGTLDGDKIVCPNSQFLGADESFGHYVYFKAAKGTIEMVEIPGYGTFPVNNISLTNDEAVTFTYNADDCSFSTEQLFLVNDAKDKLGNNYLDYAKATYTTFAEVAATPANPSMTSFHDIIEGYGFGMFLIDMPNQDVDGNYINQDNMYYNLYIDDKQIALPNGETNIPYAYVDGDFFMQVSGTAHTFKYYDPVSEKVGFQTFYKVGDEVNQSELVWYYIKNESDAIASVDGNKQVVSTEYFDLTGKRLAAPATKGLFIQKTTYSDGTQRTVKTAK